jgi:hypothetical protein
VGVVSVLLLDTRLDLNRLRLRSDGALPQADIDGRKIDTTDRVQVAADLKKARRVWTVTGAPI